MAAQTQARDLFRAAYENRYTWDSDFPGYVADVELRQGDEVHTGKIRVASDLTVEIMDIADETIQESLYTQMRDVITHRKHTPFDKAHGSSTFTLGKLDSSGSQEIIVEGDAMGSNYCVREKQISLVSRVMGRMAFIIHHKKSLETGAGYISSDYSAVFRNPKTNEIIRQMEFEDTYEPVGSYYVMTRQVVRTHEQGETSLTDIQFSNVKLLQPAAV
ncbi:DUF3386 domain-containing protein [Acaryochloris sp. CCMEE 5410]|uniref:DUF3386 domain-containing protein n=1 Tax=Acaryochloris sp. CCMEE 5410 TaxID=310037 RepID=UPI0002483E45|nr:DUF3386 domain-containing protein [Acaryochloris sp. CCMEE 5410]KAI9134805.1 DUF3386 domain-containing protein [Acaryochloris sp. CCMEE 5410]